MFFTAAGETRLDSQFSSRAFNCHVTTPAHPTNAAHNKTWSDIFDRGGVKIAKSAFPPVDQRRRNAVAVAPR